MYGLLYHATILISS